MRVNFSFSLVERRQQALILEWLEKPHVRKFFYGKGLQATIDDLEKQVSQTEPFYQHWIAYQETHPFGYLMTSRVDPFEDEERFERHRRSDGEAITLDLLIGEEAFLGKGLSVPMIQTFLYHKFAHVSEVFIDPEVCHSKAIHVYEKAGFQKRETFFDGDPPRPHWLMQGKIEDLTSSFTKGSIEK